MSMTPGTEKMIKSAVAKVDKTYGKSLSESERDDLRRFIHAFFETTHPEDLEGTTASNMAAVAYGVWKKAEKRQPGKASVVVYNTSKRHGWSTPHTVIQIVNDDMPFLVDSVTAGLSAERRLGIHVVHHPIIEVERDKKGKRIRTVGPVTLTDDRRAKAGRESYIHIEVDAQSRPDVKKQMVAEIQAILEDVRLAVTDFRAMLAKIDETVASLTVNPPPVDEEDASETIAFLRWMADDHFTFIGYKEYSFTGTATAKNFRWKDADGFGLLRNPERHVLRGSKGLTVMSDEIRDFLTKPDPITITKANVKSSVHRVVHLDYVGVKIFNDQGNVVGERRFVGLFTSQSYGRAPHEVPILRRKVERVKRRSGFDSRSHLGKALTHILDSFPRDEAFQMSEDSLFETTTGILHLMERPQAKAYVRRDTFGRFVSALVFVPRDRYNTGLRRTIETLLCDAFHGEMSVYYANLSNDVLARWHFIIRTKPGDRPEVNMDKLNAAIVEAAKGWALQVRELVREHHGEEDGNALAERYEASFSTGYQEDFEPRQAIIDIDKLESLDGADDVAFDLYRRRQDADHELRLKIYHASSQVTLSRCLPMLENLGFEVVSENSYLLIDGSGGSIHDFFLRSASHSPTDAGALKPFVEELLSEVWWGRVEDDGFNALTVRNRVPWRKVVILRAYAKFLRQIGLPFSQDYVEDCMRRNNVLSELMLQLFHMRFDPKLPKAKNRKMECSHIEQLISSGLDDVSSLDEDRILRNFLNVIRATVRTNAYTDRYLAREGDDTQPAPALAFKIDSEKLEEAPRPRPYREIWVYSPRVEGVHLRGGPVARGGLRWSDRREDFRTEVLGLVKAQQVKNAVIVPVGAKGGFFPKQLTDLTDRKAFLAEGTACYRIFITSLLSLTDNLVAGRVRPPAQIVRHDSDDPYLVVAADKGTATFSDIANGLAIDHGFWLGDAFASGGSNGYDHKKMGITARGAWVSVQRHFREMGVDVQTDPVAVIGIGDMSGDVFGNGMLLSKSLKLKAAFDHRHIFLDPDPDPGKSWRERNRLFKKARSSWDDYNRELISKGGGIFPRDQKSILLSAEVREWLGIEEASLSPLALINTILKSEADLLWIGGIGTYAKATSESHMDVGDRANNAIRVNARELRVKVVGEGGNLGITQLARIEFDRHGGRINTDFIDNSAGVDCSDKEVNIKILLAEASAKANLIEKDRVSLLAKMTSNVSDIVLSDNYLQTLSISMAESRAVEDREHHAGLIRALERDDRLDREIEGLPTDKQFTQMEGAGLGMTRPEISTLLAHAKMAVFDALVESPLMDDKGLRDRLEWGFPKALRSKYGALLNGHRLKREIIATTLSNEVINRCGLSFVHEIREESGRAIDEIIAAYEIVHDAYDLPAVWKGIDALDNQIDAKAQIALYCEIADFLKRRTIWFLHSADNVMNVQAVATAYKGGLSAIIKKPEAVATAAVSAIFKARYQQMTDLGVPRALARHIAAMTRLDAASDIVQLAGDLKRPVEDVAKAYFTVGEIAGFNRLTELTKSAAADGHWDRLALSAVAEDLAQHQHHLVQSVLNNAGKARGGQAVKRWIIGHEAELRRAARLVDELQGSGAATVAKLSFAARHLHSILPLNP